MSPDPRASAPPNAKRPAASPVGTVQIIQVSAIALSMPAPGAAPNAHAANTAATAGAAAAGNASAVAKTAIKVSLSNIAFLLEREKCQTSDLPHKENPTDRFV